MGSLQRFVDADFDQHYFTLLEEPRHHGALQAMAAFDLVANNADRKGGHCLLDAEDRIWGIDHGLCFNTAPKLRTVIWDFAGQAIPEPLLADLRRLALEPPAALEALLGPLGDGRRGQTGGAGGGDGGLPRPGRRPPLPLAAPLKQPPVGVEPVAHRLPLVPAGVQGP